MEKINRATRAEKKHTTLTLFLPFSPPPPPAVGAPFLPFSPVWRDRGHVHAVGSERKRKEVAAGAERGGGGGELANPGHVGGSGGPVAPPIPGPYSPLWRADIFGC